MTDPSQPINPAPPANRPDTDADRTHYPGAADDSRLVDLLDGYLESLRRGECPDREALKRSHPELAEQLEACLAGIDFIHGHRAAGGEGGSAAGPESGAAGRQIGEFQLVREVGRGGMGAVYEAQQLPLGRKVALKVLHFGPVPDPHALDRFRREAETVAKLHHTNIVPIFSVGSQEGVNYYAMQFIEGRSLDREVQRHGGAIEPNTAADWALQAAEALAHAHQRGVIHRDVKPSNLILDEEGRIWLTDFGLAKRLDDVTLSLTGAILGTPRYMSPEQASAATRQIDHRTDIYSLGATLYELATGRPLFSAETPHGIIAQILGEEPPRPRAICPALPRDLETIILKCLDKDAARRYGSMKQVADDLRAFLDDRPIQARRSSPWQRAARWVQRRRQSVTSGAIAAAGTAAAIGIAMLSWLAYHKSQQAELQLLTETAPLVAEFLNQDGSVRVARTVPTQTPFPVAAGRHTLRLTAARSWSRTAVMDVVAGQRAELDVRIDDNQFQPPIELERAYTVVDTLAGPRLFALDNQGIRTLATSDLTATTWIADLSAPLLPKRAPGGSPARSSGPQQPASEQLQQQPPWAVWPWRQHRDRLDGAGRFGRRPYVVGERDPEHSSDGGRVVAPDVNGDGISDLVVAGRHQAWLLAISGADGRLLWTAHRGIHPANDLNSQRQATHSGLPVVCGATAPPLLAGDLNGDQVTDLAVSFISVQNPTQPRRWIEAFSGADGKTLWTAELAPGWFADTAQPPVPTGVFSWSNDRGGFFGSNAHQTLHGEWPARRPPHPPRPTGGTFRVNGRLRLKTLDGSRVIVFVAGDQLVGLNPETGERRWTHALGSRPATEPRWVPSDIPGKPDLVFLDLAPTNAPGDEHLRTRLVAWSFEDQRTRWFKPQAYFPAGYARWTPQPRWPLTVDLEGDGTHEIVSVSDSSYNPGGFQRSVPWSRLAVYDAASGVQRWEAVVLTLDQQANQFAVGPDIDRDGTRELFAATVWGADCAVYAEAFSGRTGETLWSNHAKVHGSDTDVQVANVFWRRLAGTEHDEFVVHCTFAGPMQQENAVSVAFAPGSGAVNAVLQDSPLQMQAVDLDQDGSDELLSFYDATEQGSLDQGGTLHVERGPGRRLFERLGDHAQPCADLDGDGTRELVVAGTGSIVRMLSGVDGALLWTRDFRTVFPTADFHNGQYRCLAIGEGSEGDIDGDEVPDLVFVKHHFGRPPSAPFVAVSGASGKLIWSAPAQVRVAERSLLAEARDLDNDGRRELVLALVNDSDLPPDRQMVSSTDAKLWLAVYDAASGQEKWKRQIAPAGSQLNYGAGQLRFVFEDLNNDGVEDVLGPSLADDGTARWLAVSGVDGAVLWKTRLGASPQPGLIYAVPPAAVADLDGDGLPEAILLQLNNQQGNRQLRASVVAVSGSDGRAHWTWETQVSNELLNVRFDEAWFHARHRPLVLRSADGQPRIVCLLPEAKLGVAELIVLDAVGGVAHRQTFRDTYAHHGSHLAVADADGRVGEELLCLADGHLHCLNPGDWQKPLWQFPVISIDGRRLLGAAPGRRGQRSYAVVSDRRRNDLLFIDLANGQLAWKCTGPEPRKGTARLLLSQLAVLRPPTDREPPVSLATWGAFTSVREGQRGPQADRAEQPRAATAGAGPQARDAQARDARTRDARAFAGIEERRQRRGREADPRWTRQLPWAGVGNEVSSELVGFLLFGSLLALSMLLIPAWFAAWVIGKRRFGLRTLLVAFVLIGVSLTAAHLPHNGYPQGWGPRLLASLAYAPPLLLAGHLVTLAARGRWRKLIFWPAFCLVIAAVTGSASLLVADRFAPVLEGMRYRADGAWWILAPSAYVTSLVFMIVLGGTSLGRAGGRMRSGKSGGS